MSLVEVVACLEQISDTDWGDKRFLASLQGVDLDNVSVEGQETEREVMERIVAKANAMLSGQDPEDNSVVIGQEFAQMGIDYEVM